MNETARLVMLKSLPFFGGLPENRLQALAREAVCAEYPAGAALAMEGEQAEAFHLVAAGRIKLFKINQDGREQTLYVLGPGEPFCLCVLAGEEAFPAFAAALTQARILSFPLAGLILAAKEEPEVLFDLMRILCGRLKDAMSMVESLALRGLPERLALFLLHESAKGTAGRESPLELSQRELAKIVGATPEAVSRSLRRFADAGLVETKGGKVYILDRPGLAREAGETAV